MKICINCGVEKPHTEFAQEPRRADGHRNDCKECRREYHRANSKKHYARTRTEKLAKVKAYAAMKADEIKVYQHTYHTSDEHRAKERERSRKRRADPAGNKHRAYLTRRYLARRFNNPGYCTKQQLDWRWEYYGHKCWICRQPAKETDHVIPVSKGGSNWPGNLRPICKPCNVRKGNMWPYVPQLVT